MSQQSRDAVALSTKRLALREFEADDWAALHAIIGDAATMQYMDFGSESDEATKALLTENAEERAASPRRAHNLAAALGSSGEVIGSCGLYLHEPARGIAELYYALRRDAWGQGYATEIAEALLCFGFAGLRLHRVFASAAIENTASWRVLEKAGMRREGLMRQALSTSGGWRDAYSYAILGDEWRARRQGEGGKT